MYIEIQNGGGSSGYEYAKSMGVNCDETLVTSGYPKYGTEAYLITIGKHVLLAGDVMFINHEGAHFVLKGMEFEKFKNTFGYGRITIEDNVYVGARTTILRGVTIGANSVVGAGSLVNKSLPPNGVYAGVPAKRICSVEEWGEKFYADMPEYDVENYKKNKKDEILKIVDKFKKR